MAWRSLRCWLTGVGLAVALGGCGGGGPGPAAPLPLPPTTGDAAAAVSSTYKLGSGDKIRLTVFRDDSLSGEFTLDGAGNFAMPLIGEVEAAGLTTRELEARIRDKALAADLLKDPQVSVQVLNYRPFYILGEVKTPGAYPYVNGMTVLNAVALAGGFSYRAKQSDFLLQRGGSNMQGAEVAGDTPLLPGDIVTVQERFF
jgi:protein involved in polysaccharide export with SLBB domain